MSGSQDANHKYDVDGRLTGLVERRWLYEAMIWREPSTLVVAGLAMEMGGKKPLAVVRRVVAGMAEESPQSIDWERMSFLAGDGHWISMAALRGIGPTARTTLLDILRQAMAERAHIKQSADLKVAL